MISNEPVVGLEPTIETQSRYERDAITTSAHTGLL